MKWEKSASTKWTDGRARAKQSTMFFFFLLSSSSFIRVAYSVVPVELSCFEDLSRIKFIFVILYLLGVQEKLGVFGIHMRCGPCQSSLSLLVFSSRLFFFKFIIFFHRSRPLDAGVYIYYSRPKLMRNNRTHSHSYTMCGNDAINGSVQTPENFLSSVFETTFSLSYFSNTLSRYFPLFWFVLDRNIRFEANKFKLCIL